MRRFEGRDERSNVYGDDGDNDTGQEDGRQFVDVLHTNKDQQGHEEETDGAVDTHVVQHSCAFALGMLGFKDGSLWYDIHLGRQTEADSEKVSGCHEISFMQGLHRDALAFITPTCFDGNLKKQFCSINTRNKYERLFVTAQTAYFN